MRRRLISLFRSGPGSFVLFADSAFDREIAKSEHLRVRLFAGFFGGVFLFSTAANLLFAEEAALYFKNKVDTWVFVYFFVAIFLYYVVLERLVDWARRNDRMLPSAPRYGNAFGEGLIPTIGLLLFFPEGDPAAGLTMPPLLAYAFFIILSILRLEFGLSMTTGTAAAASYFGFTMYVLAKYNLNPNETFLFAAGNHISKTFFLLAAGVMAGFVAVQVRRRATDAFSYLQQKEEVEQIFGRHVSPQVVSRLLESEQPSAEERNITVMFLDIRNFTTFSETRTPAEVYAVLNNMFAFMIEIVSEEEGIINKFLGDGFLAVFGAPLDDDKHSLHALQAAYRICRELERKRSEGSVPELSVGIGLHTGRALTGNLGSSRRTEYTIIGDVVNTAARIEQLTKEQPYSILFSAQVFKHCKSIADSLPNHAGDNPSDQPFGLLEQAEGLGTVGVKGRTTTVELYGLK